jgi:hypothetical protein
MYPQATGMSNHKSVTRGHTTNEANMDEGIAGQLARIIARLDEIERKIDHITEQLGLSG